MANKTLTFGNSSNKVKIDITNCIDAESKGALIPTSTSTETDLIKALNRRTYNYNASILEFVQVGLAGVGGDATPALTIQAKTNSSAAQSRQYLLSLYDSRHTGNKTPSENSLQYPTWRMNDQSDSNKPIASLTLTPLTELILDSNGNPRITFGNMLHTQARRLTMDGGGLTYYLCNDCSIGTTTNAQGQTVPNGYVSAGTWNTGWKIVIDI